MSGKLIHVMVVVLVAGIVGTSLGDVLDPSVVSWWRFDEESGTVAADSGGLGLDGAVVSGPIWSDDGPRKGCLYFDGDDDHVRIAHNDSLNPGTGDFTITFWANVDPTPGTRGDGNWDVAIGKRNSGSVGYYVGAYRPQGTAEETGWRFMLGDMTGTGRKDTGYKLVTMGEWAFVAAVLDRANNQQRISVDGGRTWASIAPPAGAITPSRDLTIGWDVGSNNFWFHGKIDDVAMFSRALSNNQIKLIMEEGMTPALAKDLYPKDRTDDVPPTGFLSWVPGRYAVAHDVYLGKNQVDVGAASRTNPLNVLASTGHSVSECDLGPLEIGQTYYWRVDEVNALPDSTIFKGEVWRFTVEPMGITLGGEHIQATASSSSSADEGPQNTITGLGLDPNDLHSVDATQMWLSGEVAAGESASIQYEFDQAYSLHQMLVWNHNTQNESVIGFGIKEAIVEYSLDGSDWKRLGDVYTFNQGSGKADYGFNTTVEFGGAVAQYVRITAVGNWKDLLKQYGLSEVRFLYIPVRARQLSPIAGARDVHPSATLRWHPGRSAVRHDVYLSIDEQSVIDRTAPVVARTEASLVPDLTVAQTYYWRVDEVNEADSTKIWEGDRWSFSTPEYLVVDDFESYRNDSPNRVFQTWLDGWGFSADAYFPVEQKGNGTGAVVGYNPEDGDVAETAIIHEGRQSMPLEYNNDGSVNYSEAQRFFDEPQNWTLYGAKALILYYRGMPGNSGQLYVKINNVKKAYPAADLTKGYWQTLEVDLATVSGANSVRELTIGIEGAGTKGMLYIDDIRLYPKAPEPLRAVEPDRTHLLAYYNLDGSAADSSGNGYHGLEAGGPLYVAGVLGQAMLLDGADDHVRIAHQDRLNPGTGSFTIACWACVDLTPGTSGTIDWDLAVAKRETAGTNGYYLGAQRSQGNAAQTGWKFMLGKGNASADRVDTPFVLVPMGEWVFVAGVLDRAQNVHKISVDGGRTWRTATPPNGPIVPATDLAIGWDIGQNNYWFRGMIDEVRLYDQALTDAEVLWLAGGR